MLNKNRLFMVMLLMFICLTLTGCKDTKISVYFYYDINKVDTVKVEKGTPVTEPVIPTKDGYTFQYWYRQDSDTAYDFNKLVTESFTLYTKWLEVKEDDVVISFYNNTKHLITTNTAKKGEKITDITASEKNVSGYIFDYWCTDDTFNAEFNMDTLVYENTSLYGHYTERKDTIYTGYYEGLGLETAEDSDVKDILQKRLESTMTAITYGDVSKALETVDINPDNPGKLLGIYDNSVINNVWDSGSTWNKEHVWCQSHLGAEASNPVKNIASDIHNLRACNPGVNSRRNNRYYDDYPGNTVYKTGLIIPGVYAWYPGDDFKGDVARILFYMDTRYPQLSLTNKVYSQSSKDLEFSMLDSLVRWHEEDPVDAFEIRRNELIYYNTEKPQYSQSNRNPYIDYPELANRVYGEAIPKKSADKEVRVKETNVNNIYIPEYAESIDRKHNYSLFL